MKNIVNTYVEKFKGDHQKSRRMAILMLTLALLVAVGVFWQLHSTGIALSNETTCGQEEHTHTEECYAEDGSLICGLEEHVHTASCLSDESADVETAEDWEATLPELTGVWADDVVAIAESQLGYTESTANYILADDGVTRKGYTRYGAWAGNAYGDWDAMFISFCLHYAGITTEDFPESTGAYAWTVMLQELDLYADAADDTPSVGDLVFLDTDEDGKTDRVGIVQKLETEMMVATDSDADNEATYIYVILGDHAASEDDADAVCEVIYNLKDEKIIGYGVLPEQEIRTQENNVVTYTACDTGVTVTVTAPEGALPENAVLSVTLLSEDSDIYAEAVDAVGYDEENEDTGMAALDISFTVDGEEVEPSEAVKVTIDASGLLPEEADASTIEVQHLTETEDGIEAVLVADAAEETEGTVDPETATAEFEVESFSTFTVTWSSSGPGGSTETNDLSITVYVDGSAYTGTVSDMSLSSGGSVDLTTLLSSSDYTFSSASVVYDSGSTEEATAITYSKNGPNGSYTITTGSSSISNVNSITSVSVYYVSNSPSVAITAEKTNTGYTLTATQSNFTDTNITYEWSVDDTSAATISENGSSATLTWSENVESGTSVTVTVTATSSTGEIATNTYAVTYGSTSDVTFYVYYPSSSKISVAASGVTVYAYDSNGILIDSGTTDSNGQVTLSLIDGVTYTVEASYTSGSYTYSFDGEVTADATNGNVISLLKDGTYEHIDIKYTTMSSGDNFTLTGITSVYVYNSSGNLVNYTSSVDYAEATENWQSKWTDYSNDNHSIEFDLDYTVVITYTATVNGTAGTYVATIDKTTTYPDGTYYPADGANAWQIYNYLYGTDYASEDDWKSSSDYSKVSSTGIDISGLTYYEIAIALCDSWGDTSKSGLDFALDVKSLLYTSTGWDFEVLKTYENNDMSSGIFTFNLYKANFDANSEIWTLGDLLQSQSNSAATADTDGNSQDTISFTQISYSASEAGTYYYIISEETGSDSSTIYDSTIYGVKVVVTVTEVKNSNNVVTSYKTEVTPTYYVLTAVTDSYGNVTGYNAEEITTLNTSTEGLVIFPFTNTYNSGYVLPSTGGTGTWLYTLTGAAFCGGTGIFLRRRRKRA